MWANRISNIWFGLSTRYEKEYAKEARPVIWVIVNMLRDFELIPDITYMQKSAGTS
jgi:acyl-CoA hydrolase